MAGSINKRKTGATYERRAAEYLANHNVTILDMNFSLKGGEIDIIGIDQNTYIFVEVKYRKDTSFGHPSEAVTYNKQKTICRIATLYMKIKKLPLNGSFRFDVISILKDEIIWYKNAFYYHI
ncbi:MAG: YraN family protein [Lachnospiraceae bacterium]|nr:YraN family protein [Lachnospiraceae bacterium]